MGPFFYAGYHVIPSEVVPRKARMTCSKKFTDMFPELAAETNAWMRNFFGADRQVIICKITKTVHIHPDDVETLFKGDV